MYAGWPPTLTFTLSSVVGRLPLTMALAQVSVVEARRLPLMVSHALGATPGRKLAPRSEERRVGKECRSRGGPDLLKDRSKDKADHGDVPRRRGSGAGQLPPSPVT